MEVTMNRVSFVAGAVAALAVCAAALGGLQYTQPAKAAADGKLGMAMLGAYVGSDAVIRSASGVTSVSSIGNGQYSVIFDRDVSNCIFSGTVANASLTFLTVSPYLTPPQVRVVVFTTGGTAVNSNFHVMAFCPR
jgi:hypothetical protein